MDSQVTLPVAAWAAWRPTTPDDEPPPAVYRELVDSPRAAYALAVRLEPNATHRAVRMRWEPSDVEDDAEAATEAFIACLEGGAAASWRGGGSAWHWTQGGNA